FVYMAIATQPACIEHIKEKGQQANREEHRGADDAATWDPSSPVSPITRSDIGRKCRPAASDPPRAFSKLKRRP
ncbi:hypothetical protein ACC677_37820, partial [Rhizobium ruizarguesonis]